MSPFLVRERVGVKMKVVAHDGIEEKDVEPIGHVYFGVL